MKIEMTCPCGATLSIAGGGNTPGSADDAIDYADAWQERHEGHDELGGLDLPGGTAEFNPGGQVIQPGDPDDIGAKPVAGHVTGAQLQVLIDQFWRGAGVKRFAGEPIDPDERFLITEMKVTAAEEFPC